MVIAALARLTPRPGAGQELLERLQDVAKDVRTEPGNLLTAVLRDPDRPDDVVMLEVFRDQEAVEAHRVARHSVEKGPPVHALLAFPMQTKKFDAIDWPE